MNVNARAAQWLELFLRVRIRPGRGHDPYPRRPFRLKFNEQRDNGKVIFSPRCATYDAPRHGLVQRVYPDNVSYVQPITALGLILADDVQHWDHTIFQNPPRRCLRSNPVHKISTRFVITPASQGLCLLSHFSRAEKDLPGKGLAPFQRIERIFVVELAQMSREDSPVEPFPRSS